MRKDTDKVKNNDKDNDKAKENDEEQNQRIGTSLRTQGQGQG